MNDMPDIQFSGTGWQGQPGAEALLTTRRQFGEFEATFSLGVCEQPQRVQFRHHPMGATGGRHVALNLTRNLAQATVVTAAGSHDADAVSLTAADAHEVRLLASGNRVELRGFGAFSVKKRDSRMGRNPRTGESVSVDEKYVPFFKTGKRLRDRLNGR